MCGTENEYVCMYVSASPTMELQEHATGSRSQPPSYVVLGIQSPNSQFYLFFSKFTNFFYFICEFAFHILEQMYTFYERGLLHLFIPMYVRHTQSQLIKHFNFTFTFVFGVGHQHTSVNILLAQELLKANYI